jgi:type IV secretory pathway VirB10-like protein
MERRKIIIPTGAQPDEPLPTPHFDAEATLTARRVVPLSEQDTSRRQHGGYAKGAAKPFWKRPALLALIVLVAIGLGVAAGFAISMYRNRQTAQTPAASAPPATVENAKAGQPTVEQPAQTPTPQARVVVPEKPAETPAEQKDDDDQEVVPPVVRGNKHDQKNDNDDDAQAPDEKQAERERRREERREARRRQREGNDPLDVRGQINRAGRQISNRIREIFEGRQP